MARKRHVTEEDLYRFHVANLRSIEVALREIESLSKEAIKKNRSSSIAALLRTHVLLVGAWTECRLRKLLYEKAGFKSSERAVINRANTQHSRWKRTVEIGFKRRYKVRTLTVSALGYTAYTRCHAIIEALEKDIRPVVEIRNKLAHGQWEYMLTNKEDDVSDESMERIKKENLLASMFRLQVLGHIASLIHDLIVSKSFERDFDNHYRRFVSAQSNLRNRSYSDYVRALQIRYGHGQRRRGIHT